MTIPARNVTQDIVAKLWNLCNVLKDDGVTYHQYVTELTYLLFLKMAKETNTEKDLPKGYRWDDLETKSAPERLSFYKLLLIHLGDHGSLLVREIFANASSFIKTHRDEIPALLTVLTRPRELTRKQLRELAMELDRAGFSEANITTAWREMTNQDIAAHIIGFIRHLATGDPLVPYEQRVDWALSQILAARQWRQPQRDWLMKIAAQTKANVIVDRDALDDPDLIFSRDGGGFARLDKMFDGQLTETLETFNDLIWKTENH